MAEIGKMPSSCSDLQRMGHKISGLYSVIGTRTVEMVYCNFYPNGKGKKKKKQTQHIQLESPSFSDNLFSKCRNAKMDWLR